MTVDDIRDKVFETLQGIKGRLEESDAYLQLKERYDSLPPLSQKAILGFAGVVAAYIVLQLPLGYYDQGSENLALYEENRDLVLDLYKVKRHAAITPQSAPPLQASELEGRARMAINNARVQAEQIKSISGFDNAGPRASSFIPKNVTQAGVEVQLANLNLSQIVDIGHSLTNISSAKVIGLEVKPGAAPGNYFDATYKVVSFNIPAAPAPKGRAK